MRKEVTPQRTCDFEQPLDRLLRQIGRVIVQWVYNRIEPAEAEEMPQRIRLGFDEYRRNRRTPRRCGVDCLFGNISLSRFVYQSVVAGESGVFPLEQALGIVRGLATPALADGIGRLVADLPQQQTLIVLRERFSVSWSVASLRKVTAALSAGLSPLRMTSPRAIRLSGIVVREPRPGWVTLEVPPLEEWTEPLKWLTPHERERIESPQFCQILQQQLPGKYLAWKNGEAEAFVTGRLRIHPRPIPSRL